MRRYVLFAVLLLAAGHEAVAQLPCTGLCLQQQSCPGGGTTSVSGKIFAPNGIEPLPNVFVYVPNGGPAPDYGVQAFAAGVQMPPVSGAPLVQTKTASDGSFTLTNMPVGSSIPLVMQAGKWRRFYTIPGVTACINTALPASGAQQTRFARKTGEFTSQDTMPRIAVVTGALDAIECSLRKFGILDSEFSDPPAQGGTGHVNFYLGSAPAPAAAGAQYSAATPSESVLFSSLSTLNQFDTAILSCQGSEDAPTNAFVNNLVNFANVGGRVFVTHSNYPWLSLYTPFSSTANWNPNQTYPPVDPQTAHINQTFPMGLQLAQWSQVVNGGTLGQMPLGALRQDLNGLVPPTQSWLTIDTPVSTMQFTFNAPVGLPATNQYGLVLYHDYHIDDTASAPTTGVPFPSECTTPATTAQERVLEYDLFALAWTALPAVTNVSANAGTLAGGTVVTITGSNFTAATTVQFGANSAPVFATSSNGSTITAVTPAGSAGTVDVVVTTPAGTSATSAADQFTYADAPSVTNVSPNAGPTAGGTSLTITGTNLTGATSVMFGATAAASFTVNSATSIAATTPAESSGTVDVVVTTAGGSSATSAADQFTYSDAPTVTNISPASGPAAGGTSVTITGTNFSGATAVTFGAAAAASFIVNSATSISTTAPAGTGTVDVVVTTLDGASATSAADQYTYVEPGTTVVVLTTSCQTTFVAGQNFSATASVTGSSPTGTVDFLENGNNISGCTGVALSTNSADCEANNLPIGKQGMIAIYNGDANNSPNGSSPLDLTVLDPTVVIWRNSFEQVIAGCPTQ
jgi:hypothetical protein